MGRDLRASVCGHRRRHSSAGGGGALHDAVGRPLLARLAAGAPGGFVTADVEPYIEALDRVLLNRQISRHEADELVTVVGSSGLIPIVDVETFLQMLDAMA